MKLKFHPPLALKFHTGETRVSYERNWSFLREKLEFLTEETVGISALFCIFVATNRVIGLLMQD